MTASVLDTGTVIDESNNAVFFTAAADVPNRTHQFITIHWWGTNPDGTLMTSFDAVTATFCNGNKQTSAHYAVEAGRAACYVSPDDVAWACGNWDGNISSVSIECNPRASDGDYREIASMIRWIRGLYGYLPLVPHNHWTSTECPGIYDLGRLEQLAGGAPSAPAPAPQEADVAITQDDANLIANTLLGLQIPRQGGSQGGNTNLYATIAWLDANLQSIRDLVNASKAAPAPALTDQQVTNIVNQLAPKLGSASPDQIAASVMAAIKAQANK